MTQSSPLISKSSKVRRSQKGKLQTMGLVPRACSRFGWDLDSVGAERDPSREEFRLRIAGDSIPPRFRGGNSGSSRPANRNFSCRSEIILILNDLPRTRIAMGSSSAGRNIFTARKNLIYLKYE